MDCLFKPIYLILGIYTVKTTRQGSVVQYYKTKSDPHLKLKQNCLNNSSQRDQITTKPCKRRHQDKNSFNLCSVMKYETERMSRTYISSFIAAKQADIQFLLFTFRF